MQFIGTRSGERVSAPEAVYNGLSAGGGLYVPVSFPLVGKAEREKMEDMSYAERAKYILSLYFGEFGDEFLTSVSESALKGFEGKDEVPLVKIDDGRYVLELFRGQTCSVKDLSVNIFAPLFKEAKKRLNKTEKTLILAATSGNTGVSLIDNFKDDEDVYVAAFYPEEGLSKMQRLNLTVMSGERVYVAGLIPEIVWYFSAYADLCSSGQIEDGEEVDFSVASGNLNAAVAGWYAKKMGLPVRKLFVPFNRNKAALDLFTKGALNEDKSFRRTMAKGLDVAVPLNAERLVFELSGRNAASTAERMRHDTGVLSLTESERAALVKDFYAEYASEDELLETSYSIFEEYGYVTDVETGVAAAVTDKYRAENEDDETPLVLAATVNPFKCPQDVLYCISGNDVKDSYKGVKRLNLLTAMKPPKFVTELRYIEPRFKDVLPAEGKRLTAALLDFVDGNFVPETKKKR